MRDLNGQEIVEGDVVLFPTALGQATVGRVVSINSGIATPSNPQAIPCAIVNLQVMVQIPPNGVVAGMTKLANPQTLVGG
jgi:hypothetical protein